jgi:hypothetical protein
MALHLRRAASLAASSVRGGWYGTAARALASAPGADVATSSRGFASAAANAMSATDKFLFDTNG